MEPDVPSILGRNLNLLLFLALNVRNMIFTYNRLLSNVLLLIGSPKSVKIPTKKGESVDEIALMALCFQFIRTKIRVYPSISFYIRV